MGVAGAGTCPRGRPGGGRVALWFQAAKRSRDQALATKLFRDGEVSYGTAAKLAAMVDADLAEAADRGLAARVDVCLDDVGRGDGAA
jgi:hypothetical protein